MVQNLGAEERGPKKREFQRTEEWESAAAEAQTREKRRRTPKKALGVH